MGTTYHCYCNNCHHDFTVYDGDGMRSIGLICKTCGKRASIPRNAPRPPREGRDVPSFLQTSRYFSLPPIPDEQIRRFTDEELADIEQAFNTGGTEDIDQWDDFELAKLISLKAPCQCETSIDFASKTVSNCGPNTLTRCPACRSCQIEAKNVGLWD